jgi:COMPASS component SWD1
LPADPFKSVALPEVIEEYLDYGVAKCCAFNRRGTLLASKLRAAAAGAGAGPGRLHLIAEGHFVVPVAAGTEDGYIIIWDFETRGVAKVLAGHR